MNSNFVSGCPERRHSILCWDGGDGKETSWIDSVDLSAYGTSFGSRGETAKALSIKPFQQDQKALLLCPPLLKERSEGDLSVFLADTDPAPLPKLNPSPDLSRPLRRPLRVLLVGERQDVLATIKNLHKRGFADAGAWSVPMPYPQKNAVTQFIPRGLSHVVISVHTKYLS